MEFCLNNVIFRENFLKIVFCCRGVVLIVGIWGVVVGCRGFLGVGWVLGCYLNYDYVVGCLF